MVKPQKNRSECHKKFRAAVTLVGRGKRTDNGRRHEGASRVVTIIWPGWWLYGGLFCDSSLSFTFFFVIFYTKKLKVSRRSYPCVQRNSTWNQFTPLPGAALLWWCLQPHHLRLSPTCSPLQHSGLRGILSIPIPHELQGLRLLVISPVCLLLTISPAIILV